MYDIYLSDEELQDILMNNDSSYYIYDHADTVDICTTMDLTDRTTSYTTVSLPDGKYLCRHFYLQSGNDVDEIRNELIRLREYATQHQINLLGKVVIHQSIRVSDFEISGAFIELQMLVDG